MHWQCLRVITDTGVYLVYVYICALKVRTHLECFCRISCEHSVPKLSWPLVKLADQQHAREA